MAEVNTKWLWVQNQPKLHKTLSLQNSRAKNVSQWWSAGHKILNLLCYTNKNTSITISSLSFQIWWLTEVEQVSHSQSWIGGCWPVRAWEGGGGGRSKIQACRPWDSSSRKRDDCLPCPGHPAQLRKAQNTWLNIPSYAERMKAW